MYTVNISDISGMKSLFPVTCWGVATPSVRMIIRGKNATPCTLGIESENNVLNTFKTWNIHEVVTKFRLFKNCKWINCSNTIHLFILQWTYNTMCLSYWFVNVLTYRSIYYVRHKYFLILDYWCFNQYTCSCITTFMLPVPKRLTCS